MLPRGIDLLDLPLERWLRGGPRLTRATQAHAGTEKGDGCKKEKRMAFRGRHRRLVKFTRRVAAPPWRYLILPFPSSPGLDGWD